jgi:hypothetical protein
MDEQKQKPVDFIENLSEAPVFISVNLLSAYVTYTEKGQIDNLSDCIELMKSWIVRFFEYYIVLIIFFAVMYGLFYAFKISRKTTAIILSILIPVVLFVLALIEVYK